MKKIPTLRKGKKSTQTNGRRKAWSIYLKVVVHAVLFFFSF